MANTEVFQGIHLKNPETGTEYRLISVFDSIAVLCVMNIKQLKLEKLSLRILRNQINTERLTVIKENPPIVDVSALSEEKAEKFQLYKGYMDRIVSYYAPTFDGLAGKFKKPVIDEIASEGKVSRDYLWKLLIRYLQSGMQNYALIDQRVFSNLLPRKAKAVQSGAKSTYKAPAPILADKDFKNLETYMKRYLKSEVKTIQNAYYDMIDEKYSIEICQEREDGTYEYIRKPLPDGQYPTYRQFYYYVSRHTTQKQRNEAKETERVVRNNKRVKIGTVMQGVKGPGHVVEIDAQEMDIALVSREYPDIPVGRPIIYVMIDVMSEMILGVSLAMDNNSIVGMTNCYINLLEDKEKLCKKYCHTDFQFDNGFTMDDVWPTGVRPLTIKSDNGSDFISDEAARIASELNINLEIVPPASGSLKPIVENFFNQIKLRLDDLLEQKGLIRKTYGSKHHEQACLNYDDAFALVLTHVIAHNMHVIKSYPKSASMKRDKISAIPAVLWKYGTEKLLAPSYFANRDEALYAMMTLEKKVTFSKDGVKWNGLTYFNADDDDLMQQMYKLGSKRKNFVARSDPRDMGHLYYLKNGMLMKLSLPSDDWRYAEYFGMSRKQFDALSEEDKATRAVEDRLNMEVRIAERKALKGIIAERSKAGVHDNDTANMRQNRQAEKAAISSSRSISERFNLGDQPEKEITDDESKKLLSLEDASHNETVTENKETPESPAVGDTEPSEGMIDMSTATKEEIEQMMAENAEIMFDGYF
ncbi:MAG: Mu transposase C-terminal domain-containing protein [Lachnospiraceae bacterium]|nr:Mu transposase C-terminal domain-containing protein [Lachnospiraceae bacterium]